MFRIVGNFVNIFYIQIILCQYLMPRMYYMQIIHVFLSLMELITLYFIMRHEIIVIKCFKINLNFFYAFFECQ